MNAAIEVKTNSKTVDGSNVAGMIKGSDPVLKNEYIVYTAHLDHFGQQKMLYKLAEKLPRKK